LYWSVRHFSLSLKQSTPQQLREKVLTKRRELVNTRTRNIEDTATCLRIVVQEFTDQLRGTNMGMTIDAMPTPDELNVSISCGI
jgi:hypothetical protein